MRYVRAHEKEWKVDPHRLGIMGFSAGGHLASTVATHFDAGDPKSDDPIERESCRPDFAVLCYPVISMTEPFRAFGVQAEFARPESRSEAGGKSVQRKASHTGDAAHVFLPHRSRHRRARGKQPGVLSGPAESQGPGGTAHLSRRAARRGPGSRPAGTFDLERPPRRLAQELRIPQRPGETGGGERQCDRGWQTRGLRVHYVSFRNLAQCRPRLGPHQSTANTLSPKTKAQCLVPIKFAFTTSARSNPAPRSKMWVLMKAPSKSAQARTRWISRFAANRPSAEGESGFLALRSWLSASISISAQNRGWVAWGRSWRSGWIWC